MRAPTFSAAACNWNADEDRGLVERYRKGDREAFTELVVRYQRPVYNAAFWVLRHGEDASDVAQTVFLRAAERIDDYDPRFKFFSWIYRIAVNESLNWLRRREHSGELDEDAEQAADPDDDPAARASAGQRSRRLRSALMSLSANDRLVISLRHFHECSYAEMAQILDIEEKTVKSRLFEARQRLRGLLGDLEASAHGTH